MEIMGRKINIRYFLWYYCFNGLIAADMFLITVALVFDISYSAAEFIVIFDLIVCLILLGEYILNLYMSSPKKKFIMDPLNILGLLASIPFDFILVNVTPETILLRYLRLLKLIRIALLSSRLRFIKDLCEKTGLHKILGVILGTIILFTLLFYFFGPSYGGFDDFYFVVVTLTTVGYGDVTPQTYNEKILALILIIIGIFVFSAVTAALSSFLTDRIVNEDEKEIEDTINSAVEVHSENIMDEIKLVREENNGLKNEISELKNEINELKDLIKEK